MIRKPVSLLQQIPDFSIYLFVNSGSGGNKGKSIIDLHIETVHFKIDQKDVMVCMYDLLDPPMRKRGFMKLKQSSMTPTFSRAIVCGGDGSVMWVVEQMIRHQVSLERVPLGVIPIGTGNDFSRALGWGGEQTSTIGRKLQRLKCLCQKWIKADVEAFDLWQMNFNTYENGCLYKISHKQQVPLETKSLSKTFCNYLSIGIDGRIGYTFDKYRTSSRLLNLIVYGAIGIKKSCDRAMPLQNYISKMQIIEPDTQPFVIFDNDDPNSPYKIDSDLECICALNINSYMGGVKNIWKTRKVGITNYVPDQPPSEVSFNDGKLEFVGWASEMDLGLERTVNTAYKINQGPGPYKISFRKSDSQNHHTYFQVDGQFYKIYHPKELSIQKASNIPFGCIRILKNLQED